MDNDDNRWKKLQASAKESGAWWVGQDEDAPIDDIDLETLFGDAQTAILEAGVDSPTAKTIATLARMVLGLRVRLNAAGAVHE